ncbi:MAG: alpha/beta hydrolase [Candidatus Thorarchaeota archaeon]|jgi:alpha-beta hydrolase superfamily lysophospholipase
MKINVKEIREKFDGPYELITTSDDQKLFLRIWEPKTETVKDTAILLFHGITAYSGPYGIITEPLAEKGFNVYGLDLRGHGLSDGNRGDCPSKERYIKDLCETIAFVKKNHSKVVLLGHSLGVFSSGLVLNSCLEDIDGLVLLSGARTTKQALSAGLSLGQKLRILGNSIISPSKPVISYYREGMVGLEDPLFNFKYTYRFVKLTLPPWDFEIPDIENLPVFVGIGDSDEVFSVEAVQALHDEIPSKDKEFHIAVGGKHAEFPSGSWNPLTVWIDEHFT